MNDAPRPDLFETMDVRRAAGAHAVVEAPADLGLVAAASRWSCWRCGRGG